jgi:pyruvate dehydrogenase kinase 2/3/4
VKNSLRAVQDRFDDGEEEPPPIRLVVAEGGEDVTIKVKGGGFWGAFGGGLWVGRGDFPPFS